MFVDSKTATLIMLCSFIILYFTLIRKRGLYSSEMKGFLNKSIILIAFAYVFFQGWSWYYRRSFSSNAQDMLWGGITGSVRTIENKPSIWEWGKIGGFIYAAKCQLAENPFKLLVGFGPGGYNYYRGAGENPAVWYRVNSADQQQGIFERSQTVLVNRSSLIYIFAEMGLIGIILTIYSYAIMLGYVRNKLHVDTILNSAFSIMIIPFILGSSIYAFIYYTMDVASLSILPAWIIFGIVVKESCRLRNGIFVKN